MTTASIRHAQLIRPRHGEASGGDAAVVRQIGDTLLVAIVDVLGHGHDAHGLAVRIQRFLEGTERSDVCAVMTTLHAHIRGSRGAAVGLAAFQDGGRRLDYAAIGNTVLRRFGRTETRLVSQDGVLGQNMRTPRPQSLALERGDAVLLYTDGVRDRFSARDYPGVFHHSPTDIVQRVIGRFGKAHDDAACVAVRIEPPAAD